MATENAPHDDVVRQIEGLRLDAVRPLIISDADEVLADFMGSFERFLGQQGFYFTWESYRLNGNIRRSRDDEPVTPDEIHDSLLQFFDACTETLDPVAGSAEALAILAERAQIIILSNVPLAQLGQRQAWLDRHGIGYPLIANIGEKGPAVAMLADRTEGPIYFIDDSPRHHESVAQAANRVFRLHFVANPRLAKLLDAAPASHHRADDWPAARLAIEADLAARGF